MDDFEFLDLDAVKLDDEDLEQVTGGYDYEYNERGLIVLEFCIQNYNHIQGVPVQVPIK